MQITICPTGEAIIYRNKAESPDGTLPDKTWNFFPGVYLETKIKNI